MTSEKSSYDIQAEKFLEETKTEFSLKFLKWDKHFEDDKEKRDIYEVTLKRGERVYKFKFGQALVHSGEYILFDANRTKIHLAKNEKGKPIKNIKGFGLLDNGNSMKNKEFKEPTAYDVLACLQKSEVGEFEDFCADFGYDTDSIKAHKIYEAVRDEWNNIKMLFSDKEIEKLQEIQ